MATPIGSARLKAYTGASNTLSGNIAPDSTVTVSHSSATTLTIPAASVVNWEVGSRLFVIQIGAGAVTLAITGDTIVPATSNTTNAGDTLILTKTTATGWHCAVAAAA